MENQQPQWPLFLKAESFIVAVVVVTIFSMAFVANLNKSNILSSVFNEPNKYTDQNCDQLVKKMNQSDSKAIDEFESRCLNFDSNQPAE